MNKLQKLYMAIGGILIAFSIVGVLLDLTKPINVFPFTLLGGVVILGIEITGIGNNIIRKDVGEDEKKDREKKDNEGSE